MEGKSWQQGSPKLGKESWPRTVLWRKEGFRYFLVPFFTKFLYSLTIHQYSSYSRLPFCSFLRCALYLVSTGISLPPFGTPFCYFISLVRDLETLEEKWRGLHCCPNSVANVIYLIILLHLLSHLLSVRESQKLGTEMARPLQQLQWQGGRGGGNKKSCLRQGDTETWRMTRSLPGGDSRDETRQK